MSESQSVSPEPKTFSASRTYGVALVGLLASGLLLGLLRFSGHGLNANRGADLTDFHVFYAASEAIRNGAFADAYHYISMQRIELALAGKRGFLPWSYPPQFGMVVAPFAYMPLAAAYFVFTAGTLTAYLVVLRRLAGPAFLGVLLILLPCLVLNMSTGQNGFLSGSLVGLFCLATLNRSAWAGAPLGLMVIKPHLVIGLGAYVVLRRKWRVVLAALGVIAVTAVLATMCFGLQVWAAFLSGLAETRLFLEVGIYPLYRMASVYASFRSFGASPAVALIAQSLSAIVALSIVLVAALSDLPIKTQLGLAILGSLLFSPYLYDYDLTLLGVAFALLAPHLSTHASKRILAIIVFFSTLSTASGIAASTAMVIQFGPEGAPNPNAAATVGGIALVALLGSVMWTLRDQLAWTPRERANPFSANPHSANPLRRSAIYGFFALIATCANFLAQELLTRVYGGASSILLAMILGTGVGFFVKYALDKQYVFTVRPRDAAHDAQVFFLYCVTGLATTLVFWGFELGFDEAFQFKEMRYLGGAIGLTIGYAIKYRLDRRFVPTHEAA